MAGRIPRFLKRAGGINTGVALSVAGLQLPGGAVNPRQVLASSDDGGGSAEFIAVDVSTLGDNVVVLWSSASVPYADGWVVYHDGQIWQNQSGGGTSLEPGAPGVTDWVARPDFEDEVSPWDAGPTYNPYDVVIFGDPQHLFVNTSGTTQQGAGTDPDTNPGDWTDIGAAPEGDDEGGGGGGGPPYTSFFVRFFDPPSQTYPDNDFVELISYGPAEGAVSLAPEVWTIPAMIDFGGGHTLVPYIVFEFKNADDPEEAAQQVQRTNATASPVTETIFDMMGDGDLDTLGDRWFCSLIYYGATNNGTEVTGQNLGPFTVRGWQT